MNRSQRTDEIMRSLEGMGRADAPPYLWSKVRNRLQAPVPAPARWAWQLAIALTVFILANLFTLRQLRQAESRAGGGTQAVASEYSISLPQTY